MDIGIGDVLGRDLAASAASAASAGKRLELDNGSAKVNNSCLQAVDEACDIARKWLPPVREQDKIALMECLNGTEKTCGSPFIEKYVEFLLPYTEVLGISTEDNKPREADCVASGFLFFYACVVYIMHFPNSKEHIEDAFLYTVLYMLVDNYVDDIRVDDSLKQVAIDQMFILIKDPMAHERLPLADPVLKTIATVYHRLTTRCPNTRYPMMQILKAEIDGAVIQKRCDCTRQEYYDTALLKGGYSVAVLQHIVGDTDESIARASFQLGEITQLMDDMNDVMADREKGIHTIATHDLAEYGNLDNLWLDTINRINKIDDRFTVFKTIYMMYAVYIPDRISNVYTSILRSKTTPLNLFDYACGYDGSAILVDLIMTEISTVEALQYLTSSS